jgi:hypothetical protein
VTVRILEEDDEHENEDDFSASEFRLPGRLGDPALLGPLRERASGLSGTRRLSCIERSKIGGTNYISAVLE